jgi:hypothetical protein
MTWVAVAAVAVALAAFVIYLFVVRWRRMARHGRLQLPCDAVVRLPAGEVTIYYEDDVRRRNSDVARVPDGLSVLVSDADGGARLDLAEPPSATATRRGGATRIPYAKLAVPRQGRYRVAAQATGAEAGAVTLG